MTLDQATIDALNTQPWDQLVANGVVRTVPGWKGYDSFGTWTEDPATYVLSNGTQVRQNTSPGGPAALSYGPGWDWRFDPNAAPGSQWGSANGQEGSFQGYGSIGWGPNGITGTSPGIRYQGFAPQSSSTWGDLSGLIGQVVLPAVGGAALSGAFSGAAPTTSGATGMGDWLSGISDWWSGLTGGTPSVPAGYVGAGEDIMLSPEYLSNAGISPATLGYGVDPTTGALTSSGMTGFTNGAVSALNSYLPSGGGSGNAISNLARAFFGGGSGGGTRVSGGGTNISLGGNGGGGGGDFSWLPALLGAILGGTQGQPAPITTSTTSTSAPWSVAAPYLQSNLDLMSSLPNNISLPTVPTLTPYTNTYTDQYINNAINAAIAPLNDQYRETVMPAIRGTAIADNQPGSSRQSLSEAIASRELARASGEVSSRMLNDFANAKAAQSFAGWGQQNQDTMTTYNANLQKALQEALYPINRATAAGNLYAQAGNLGKTSTGSSTTQLPSTPRWQTALGGAIAANEAAHKVFNWA